MRHPLRPAGARHAIVVGLLLAATAAHGQQRPLTLDDLYHPEKRVDFTGRVPKASWADDTTVLLATTSRQTSTEWTRVNVATEAATPLYDAARLEQALVSDAAVPAAEARRLARPRTFEFDATKSRAVMAVADDVFVFEFANGRLHRLTSDPAPEQDPAFSPDGARVAFARGNDLFVVDVATGRERRLTTDGHEHLLNGRLDWVYQEEIYGRGTFRAFWWSPDSTRLAFLQLNERDVPLYTIPDHVPHHPELEIYPYPKAGDPNPTVRLGIVAAAGGAVTWADTAKYAPVQPLIVSVSWMPDGSHVVYQIQDREQTWLDLNLADRTTGASRTLLRETTKAWVDPQGEPEWLPDGSFLWASERSGWEHLYHYKGDGTPIRQVTSGEWEVRTIHGVDAASGWVYFSGTERSPIGSDVYRVRLDGTGLQRLSGPEGTHDAVFNGSFTHYVGSWSDVVTPVQTRLHRADGSLVRVVEENRIPALADFRLVRPEYLQVKTRDGFVMEAVIIRPPDFDPSRKYPVLQQTYAGPHAQTVKNAWGGANGLYNQLLAQHGIIVWACDNRSASGKGAVSAWPAYQRLGETELADIEDGLAWLKEQPGVDAARIGINGWSYGGFMASYALTHSRSFAMGIAGAPVTDWTQYDSIYTERFMRMPQNNPEGYRATSVTGAAANVSGRLLLLHGTVDDNVHLQNTIQLAYALQQAGKPFELMLYPRSRHGVTDERLVRHLRGTMLDFTLRTLQPEAAGPTATASR